MEKMNQIQIEYKILLQKLLSKLKSEFSVQALDEINLFWYRHIDIVRLYLASEFAGAESYVFTAATCLDYDDNEHLPFLLLGKQHVLELNKLCMQIIVLLSLSAWVDIAEILLFIQLLR